MRAEVLACPMSGVGLVEHAVEEAESALLQGRRLVPATATGYVPVGRTPRVLLRTDGLGAYPVVDDLPVLLAPEMLVPEGTSRVVDVTVEPYGEAYREMEHYSRSAAQEAESASTSRHAQHLRRVQGLSAQERTAFPSPPLVWLDATYELAAQADAYRHLAPLRGKSVLQLGGRGAQAVELLLAGAERAWVSTPMRGELLFARALAEVFGLADRLHCVVGLAEELPFADATFDAVYSQGCVHHWLVERAMPEVGRVLRAGGRFAAVEPWRGPLYGIGTKVLGKRDRAVQCVVLTGDRVAPHLQVFDDAQVVHHGALTRYPLLALWKAGLAPSAELLWKASRLDDAVTARWPRLRDTGSSVALLGTRGHGRQAAEPARELSAAR